MHDLMPLTALGGTTPQVDTVAGLTLSEIPDLALASVAARLDREDDCATALEGFLGQPAPGPGRSALGDPFTAVWMGPAQWMIGASYSDHEDLAPKVKEALDTAASVTEQSDAWVCFDLSGKDIVSVMELACPLNLRAMKPGDATRTRIHHLGCIVVCGDREHFVRILGPRASAGSLHHALLTAMRSAL